MEATRLRGSKVIVMVSYMTFENGESQSSHSGHHRPETSHCGASPRRPQRRRFSAEEDDEEEHTHTLTVSVFPCLDESCITFSHSHAAVFAQGHFRFCLRKHISESSAFDLFSRSCCEWMSPNVTWFLLTAVSSTVRVEKCWLHVLDSLHMEECVFLSQEKVTWRFIIALQTLEHELELTPEPEDITRTLDHHKTCLDDVLLIL
ncbi:hypothetical protein JOB18_004683 [Solea senegalensis]|uniref:Uncharacterized protein n=1 Tax=Solea senegalensis TaxID=28829 RepID=A0AAV6Q0Z8_SOLSE|nr:hypothetical protein JOB18_004683 [Solea senegalensis]